MYGRFVELVAEHRKLAPDRCAPAGRVGSTRPPGPARRARGHPRLVRGGVRAGVRPRRADPRALRAPPLRAALGGASRCSPCSGTRWPRRPTHCGGRPGPVRGSGAPRTSGWTGTRLGCLGAPSARPAPGPRRLRHRAAQRDRRGLPRRPGAERSRRRLVHDLEPLPAGDGPRRLRGPPRRSGRPRRARRQVRAPRSPRALRSCWTCPLRPASRPRRCKALVRAARAGDFAEAWRWLAAPERAATPPNASPGTSSLPRGRRSALPRARRRRAPGETTGTETRWPLPTGGAVPGGPRGRTAQGGRAGVTRRVC